MAVYFVGWLTQVPELMGQLKATKSGRGKLLAFINLGLLLGFLLMLFISALEGLLHVH